METAGLSQHPARSKTFDLNLHILKLHENRPEAKASGAAGA
jgi:hypothetical protein